MEFELKGALKKYRRMRSWRRAGMAIVAIGAMAAPWLLDLGRTDTLDLLARRVDAVHDQRTRNAAEDDADTARKHEQPIE